MKKQPKPKYLCCIWCGGDLGGKLYAQYCSNKCKQTATGRNIKSLK